ncbi:hypothetical protein CLU79DRAFT_716296 [Phycomyces nitens]|nr:hypothetical protein CLU79DRAFT_716296 [Phycomyces nitens]
MPTSSLMSGKSTGSKKISSPVSPTPSSRVIKKKSSRSFLKRFTSKLHPQTRPKHKVKFEQVKKSPEIQLQEQANEMTLADMTAMTALLPTQTPSSSPSYFSSSTISPLPPQPLPPLFDAPYSSAHSSYPLSVIPTLMPQLDTLSPLEQVWSTENALGQNQYALDQFNMLTDPYFMDSQMAQSICGAGLHMPTHIPLQIPSNQYTGALDYNTESYYYYGVPSTDPLFNMSLQVPSSEVSIMPTSIEQEDISPIFMHNMTGHDYTYN